MAAKKKGKFTSPEKLIIQGITPIINWGRRSLKSMDYIKRKPILVSVLLVVIIFGFLGFLLKDKFLVAVVNGKPIFRYELGQRLTSSFGKETLENLIIEKLIQDEARKDKISVAEKEIDEEVAKIGRSLGEGAKIEEVLAFQGISLKDFRQQLKVRLQVNKILENEITVSEEEITQFIKDNSTSLTATGEAEKREEAKAGLKEQKIGEKVQGLINELLTKAKISRFLK